MLYSKSLKMNTGGHMATTSLSLGEHWEGFIKNEIASGRYGSASEVVRDALRELEERKQKLEALRTHLSEGAAQAERGEFVSDYSIQGVIQELDNEG
jgi:antitoxin ParD1/3/4